MTETEVREPLPTVPAITCKYLAAGRLLTTIKAFITSIASTAFIASIASTASTASTASNDDYTNNSCSTC
jgi:hypothetical protein